MVSHTTELQKAYQLPAQGDEESDDRFRHRIAGALRDKGHLIEAHEAQQNARFDDDSKGGDVRTGIMGAMAQALHGVDYHVRGEQQIGCDIAAGILAKEPPERKEGLLLMAMLLSQR